MTWISDFVNAELSKRAMWLTYCEVQTAYDTGADLDPELREHWREMRRTFSQAETEIVDSAVIAGVELCIFELLQGPALWN